MIKNNRGSVSDSRSVCRSQVLATVVLVLLVAAVGSGIYRKTSQAVAPPIYDAMSYYAKAAEFWREVRSGGFVNPLNVEPVVRPPGSILVSGPFGFARDFRPFFFRAIFFPVVLFVGACWLVAHDRMHDPRKGWLVTAACAALLTLPMFYHFEQTDLLSVPAYWGLMDAFLAGMASMATALLILAVRRQSLPLTLCGTFIAAFTLMIKPSALFVIPAIFWGWFIELLVVHWPVRSTWHEDSRFRTYTGASSAVIVCVLSVTAFACFNSRYLSKETLAFFSNSQRLLAEMYRGVPLTALIVPQIHPWLGWHWTLLFGAIVGRLSAHAAVRGFRHRYEREDLRLLGALVVLGSGVAWWIGLAGPSEMRYLIPFVLVFVVMSLPTALSAALGLRTWARRLCYLGLSAPVVLLITLLWLQEPPLPLQRLLGVTLAAGQFREEVQLARAVRDATRALKRDLSVYALEIDRSHGMVEAMGNYQRLVDPDENFFYTLGPIDWKRSPLIRRHELLRSDYVLFRPLADTAEIKRWEMADLIDGFEAETRAIRAWLTCAGAADGFELAYDGVLRLLKVVDVQSADRSFGALLSRHHWRRMFETVNGVPLLASPADIERARATSSPGTTSVDFSGKFRLRGAIVTRLSSALEMEVLWERLTAEAANWSVFVQVLDGAGNIISQSNDPFPMSVRPGLVWRYKAVWSSEQLRGGDRVGIGIYRAGAGMLKADRGDRDWNETRLLVKLPHYATTQ